MPAPSSTASPSWWRVHLSQWFAIESQLPTTRPVATRMTMKRSLTSMALRTSLSLRYTAFPLSQGVVGTHFLRSERGYSMKTELRRWILRCSGEVVTSSAGRARARSRGVAGDSDARGASLATLGAGGDTRSVDGAGARLPAQQGASGAQHPQPGAQQLFVGAVNVGRASTAPARFARRRRRARRNACVRTSNRIAAPQAPARRATLAGPRNQSQ